jgi:hypothetical protein
MGSEQNLNKNSKSVLEQDFNSPNPVPQLLHDLELWIFWIPKIRSIFSSPKQAKIKNKWEKNFFTIKEITSGSVMSVGETRTGIGEGMGTFILVKGSVCQQSNGHNERNQDV